MDKSKIADKEIEVAKWMNKKGYDRRASKDVAPIIVEYLREFKLFDLHDVSNSVCSCGSPNYGYGFAKCYDCGKIKDV